MIRKQFFLLTRDNAKPKLWSHFKFLKCIKQFSLGKKIGKKNHKIEVLDCSQCSDRQTLFSNDCSLWSEIDQAATVATVLGMSSDPAGEEELDYSKYPFLIIKLWGSDTMYSHMHPWSPISVTREAWNVE